MAQRDNFRTISSFDLRPVFISLGLPESSFKAADFPKTHRSLRCRAQCRPCSS